MDKDKELENMMNAIRNLKSKEGDSQKMHIDNREQTKFQVNKDTNFYDRTFQNNKANKVPQEVNSTHNLVESQKQLKKMVEESVEHTMQNEAYMHKLLQNYIMTKIQDQNYMSQLIQEILKQYTTLLPDVEKQAHEILSNRITEILRECSHNLSNTLKSI